MSTSTLASRMPGGGISRRPLHFLILADCSGGMRGQKMQSLNYALADMMPHLADWEEEQEIAQVLVRAIAFDTQARWHLAEPTPVARLAWRPLAATPGGLTNMGPAFRLAGQALAAIERRALRPAVLLVTDGQHTDPPGGFESGLAELLAVPAGRAALRMALAIGADAHSEALNQFIGDPSMPVLVAENSEEIADRLVAVALSLSRMSEAGADRDQLTRRLLDGGPAGGDPFGVDTII